MTMHVRMEIASGGNRLLALALADVSARVVKPSPRRPKYEFTRAEAKALADAGLMPLSHYIELAERHGWNSTGR